MSKYTRHQGEQEKSRRIRQMARQEYRRLGKSMREYARIAGVRLTMRRVFMEALGL